MLSVSAAARAALATHLAALERLGELFNSSVAAAAAWGQRRPRVAPLGGGRSTRRAASQLAARPPAAPARWRSCGLAPVQYAAEAPRQAPAAARTAKSCHSTPPRVCQNPLRTWSTFRPRALAARAVVRRCRSRTRRASRFSCSHASCADACRSRVRLCSSCRLRPAAVGPVHRVLVSPRRAWCPTPQVAAPGRNLRGDPPPLLRS